MSDLISQITADLRSQIDSYKPALEVRDVGSVIEAGDGIARVSGLADVRAPLLERARRGGDGAGARLGGRPVDPRPPRTAVHLAVSCVGRGVREVEHALAVDVRVDLRRACAAGGEEPAEGETDEGARHVFLAGTLPAARATGQLY